MPEIVHFPEVNAVYHKDDRLDLPAFTDGQCIVSCFQFSWEELRTIIDNEGKVWLRIVGNTQPPAMLLAESPIVTREYTVPKWDHELVKVVVLILENSVEVGRMFFDDEIQAGEWIQEQVKRKP